MYCLGLLDHHNHSLGKISQAPHVIELFHCSGKIVFIEDRISSELNLKSIIENFLHNNQPPPVSKGKDRRIVSRRNPGTDFFPQGDLGGGRQMCIFSDQRPLWSPAALESIPTFSQLGVEHLNFFLGPTLSTYM